MQQTNRRCRGLRIALSLPMLLALSAAGLQRPSAPLLPDTRLTPGDTLDVSRDDVCVSGYSAKVRDVPVEVKRQVYAEYGIASHRPGDYEVDHLISLELGGSNSLRNLWPQSYKTQPWNAHVKDQLENELHAEVCSGKITLKTAQHDIARNWISAYKKYFHTGIPLAQAHRAGHSHQIGRSPHAAVAGTKPHFSVRSLMDRFTGKRGKVWVNTRSGAYWLPGSQYYGKTKEGRYMTEQQAIAQGYHPAKAPGSRR